MATVIPFKGIRPSGDKVHLVACRSVDGYTTAELNEKLSTNPFTFLHVINPDFSDGNKTVPGSIERLNKVKSKYLQFLDVGVFITDNEPYYYVYQQKKEQFTY